MQIPVVAGREFTAQDTDKSLVVIVNQAFVDHYCPHQDALGKRVYDDPEDKSYVVVGVAQTSKYDDLRETSRPFLYFPILQDYYPGAIVHARVSGDPFLFVPTLEKAVHELNADLPVFDVTTLESREQIATTNTRIAATFVGAFGLLALVLAGVGIYGVVAYSTRQRTHEIGIRMALGAQESDVFKLVLSQGLRLTIAGLAIGLVVSLALTRSLRILLFGVAPADTVTFAGVAVGHSPRRLLHPGVAGDARGSHGRVALRIVRLPVVRTPHYSWN